MNSLDKQYTDLLQDILDNGVKKEDRTGTGTISVFGRQIRHKMSEGFPLLTTKKMPFKTIVTELLWFLRGDTNIKYLVDNNCHIWDGDAYKNFEKWYNEHSGKEDYTGYYVPTKEEFIRLIKKDDEFAKKSGELGPIYGKQWRNWETIKQGGYQLKNDNEGVGTTKKHIDQIQNLINDLKTNPDSRRLMVNSWNVGQLSEMVLPPCHYGFQVYTRELSLEERCKIQINRLDGIYSSEKDIFIKSSIDEVKLMTMNKNNIPTRAISLMWNQRSCDLFLGIPFNIASYGLLLEIIAKEVNMVPEQLIGNLGDVHLYSNHVEQAKEQIGRKLTIDERMDWWFENKKPNRDVCDRVDDQSPYGKGVYFDSVGVPKTTREPFPLPKLNVLHNPCKDIEIEGKTADISCYNIFDFTLENYQSHPAIKAPLSN